MQQEYDREERSTNQSGTKRTLDQRSCSPLILLNNLQPPLTTSSRSTNESRRDSTEWAPKRTVSLGPRRPLVTIDTNLRYDGPPTPEEHASYNRVANELRTSLTELNKLIEPSTPCITRNKAPIFHNYLPDPANNNSGLRGATSLCDFGSTESINTQKEEVENELANWKTSCSINNLKSMFESSGRESSTLHQPPRPPRSGSPSVLKNSPWSELTSSQTLSRSQLPPADHSIRRTISTSSRGSIRNPYRSYYGQR